MTRTYPELRLAERIARVADCTLVSVTLHSDVAGCFSVDIATRPIREADGEMRRKVYSISRRRTTNGYELWATGEVAGLTTVRELTFADHTLYTRVVALPAPTREDFERIAARAKCEIVRFETSPDGQHFAMIGPPKTPEMVRDHVRPIVSVTAVKIANDEWEFRASSEMRGIETITRLLPKEEHLMFHYAIRIPE